MEFSALINWTNPFRIEGLFGSHLQLHPNSKSTFRKQTVQNLSGRHILSCESSMLHDLKGSDERNKMPKPGSHKIVLPSHN